MSHKPAGSTGRRQLAGSLAIVLVLVAAVLISGCSTPPDPLQRLHRQLDTYPEYSVVLADMDINGTFFKTYHHQFTIVKGQRVEGGTRTNENPSGTSGSETSGSNTPGSETSGAEETDRETGAGNPVTEETNGGDGLVFETETTGWIEVSRQFFDKYEPLLGMVVLSKNDQGNVGTENYPPGYQYVGNRRYGSWRTDSSGGSFWEFYGKYALFSHLLGSSRRPLYRSDYDLYRNSRSSGRPYFGPSNNYGTRGSYTKTSNPTFFQRQQVRQSSKNQRFSQKVKSRASSSRSRSGARGK